MLGRKDGRLNQEAIKKDGVEKLEQLKNSYQRLLNRIPQ